MPRPDKDQDFPGDAPPAPEGTKDPHDEFKESLEIVQPSEYGSDQPPSDEPDDTSASEPEGDDTSRETDDNKPAASGFDEGLLSEAEMHGISRADAQRWFTPIGLQQYVVTMKQAKANLANQQPQETDETTVESEFALDIDEDIVGEEFASTLKESWNKATRKLVGEITKLRETITQIDDSSARNSLISEQKEFDRALTTIDNFESVFGDGEGGSMDRSSEEFDNRSKVWDHYRDNKSKYPGMPIDELVRRSADFVLGDKLRSGAVKRHETDRERKIKQRRQMATQPPTSREDHELPYGKERALRNLKQREREETLAAMKS